MGGVLKVAVSLRVRIGELELKNPVIIASGTFGYGAEFSELLDLKRVGAIAVKGLTLKPREGNPPPRIVETPAGLLNSIGLQNVGVEVFLKEYFPLLREKGVVVIANINGESEEEYVEIAKILDEAGVDALEVNLSCPNVPRGGLTFGRDLRSVARLTELIRKEVEAPLIVKLSPNVTDIVEIARAAEEAGADAVSAVNTLLGMAVDIRRRRPALSTITGGLSGPAIKPVALRCVWQIAGEVGIPVIGIGGIMNWQDAVEFLMAGACAVQVGTANLVNPQATLEIVEGIRKFMEEEGFSTVEELNRIGKGWRT